MIVNMIPAARAPMRMRWTSIIQSSLKNHAASQMENSRPAARKRRITKQTSATRSLTRPGSSQQQKIPLGQ
jgi:hypothetical protein